MNTVEQILQKFHKIADSPKEQLKNFLKQNKKVIACAPVYNPEEIIHSMGLIPFGTWGGDTLVREAKAYFPSFICSIMQTILELGINGSYEGVSAIIIPSLCDSLKCLGQNWKYAVPNIPFIPMTYPQNRDTEYGVAFTRASYERVIEDLERITGATFEEEKLTKSIEIYNEHNRVMRQIAKLLGEYPQIQASDRSAIFKSAYFMEKSEHTKLVNELIGCLSQMEKSKKQSLRVVTSGILADAKELLAIFEEYNIQIVADDIAHESRQFRVDAEEIHTGLDSLASKFAHMNYCSVLYDANKGRADYITKLVEEQRADAVLVILTKFCDPEEFDYVMIKKACEEKEIPLLLLEIDRQMVNYEQVRTAVQTFSEMVG